jgi:hypothetical protein
MGTRTADQKPMDWQGTLGQMRQHGTRVAQCCTAPDCRRWSILDVNFLIHTFGEDFTLWDRRPPCGLCGRPTHYMAAPGPSTPFRPLLSGQEHDRIHKAFLKSFGFTKRDVRRIQAMAETVEHGEAPAALADLDVPFRVGACMPGQESRSTGKYLGEWAGRTLLWWEMGERETEVWRRKRATGPKPVPSTPRRPRS